MSALSDSPAWKEMATRILAARQRVKAPNKPRKRQKRASYREGVAWIAENDEDQIMNPETVSTLISVQLLGDLFGKEHLAVAKDIVRYRRKQQ